MMPLAALSPVCPTAVEAPELLAALPESVSRLSWFAVALALVEPPESAAPVVNPI